jgi:hypothetical protein
MCLFYKSYLSCDIRDILQQDLKLAGDQIDGTP